MGRIVPTDQQKEKENEKGTEKVLRFEYSLIFTGIDMKQYSNMIIQLMNVAVNAYKTYGYGINCILKNKKEIGSVGQKRSSWAELLLLECLSRRPSSIIHSFVISNHEQDMATPETYFFYRNIQKQEMKANLEICTKLTNNSEIRSFIAQGSYVESDNNHVFLKEESEDYVEFTSMDILSKDQLKPMIRTIAYFLVSFANQNYVWLKVPYKIILVHKTDPTLIKIVPFKLTKYLTIHQTLDEDDKMPLRHHALTLAGSFLTDYISDPNKFRDTPPFSELDVISADRFLEHDLSKMVTIGKGGFGMLYKNKSVDSENEYALKRLQIKKGRKNKTENFVNEFRLIQSLEHPNIIKSHGITKFQQNTGNRKETGEGAKFQQNTFIVLELCKGDLKKHIKDLRYDLMAKKDDVSTLDH